MANTAAVPIFHIPHYWMWLFLLLAFSCPFRLNDLLHDVTRLILSVFLCGSFQENDPEYPNVSKPGNGDSWLYE
jgi:hypothetical protein